MPTAFDFIKDTTSSAAPGPYVLAGAAVGFNAFSGNVADGTVVPYAVADGVGGFDTGIGTYSSSTNTLTPITGTQTASPTALAAGLKTVSIGPIAYTAGLSTQKHRVSATGPAVTDDASKGYAGLSHALYGSPTPYALAVCIDATTGAAVWRGVMTYDITTNLISGGFNAQVAGKRAHPLHANARVQGGACDSFGVHYGAYQVEHLTLAAQTQDATVTVMQIDDPTFTTSPYSLLMPAEATAWGIDADVVAHDLSTNNSSRWKLSGFYKVAASGTPALVGTLTGGTALAQDAGASAWVVTIAVNSTTKAIEVRVQGGASDFINWTCALQITQASNGP